jgi:hypothetical protein
VIEDTKLVLANPISFVSMHLLTKIAKMKHMNSIMVFALANVAFANAQAPWQLQVATAGVAVRVAADRYALNVEGAVRYNVSAPGIVVGAAYQGNTFAVSEPVDDTTYDFGIDAESLPWLDGSTPIESTSAVVSMFMCDLEQVSECTPGNALDGQVLETSIAIEPLDAIVVPGDQKVDWSLNRPRVQMLRVISPGPGFIAAHPCDCAANCTTFDRGSWYGGAGYGTGYAQVHHGLNENVWIDIDTTDTKPTRLLYAMLHVDRNPVNQYTGPGLDPPVDNPQFNVQFQVTDDPIHASMYNDCGTSDEPDPKTSDGSDPTTSPTASSAYARGVYQAGTLFILSLHQLWL